MIKGYKNLAIPNDVHDLVTGEAFYRRISKAQLVREWAKTLTNAKKGIQIKNRG